MLFCLWFSFAIWLCLTRDNSAGHHMAFLSSLSLSSSSSGIQCWVKTKNENRTERERRRKIVCLWIMISSRTCVCVCSFVIKFLHCMDVHISLIINLRPEKKKKFSRIVLLCTAAHTVEMIALAPLTRTRWVLYFNILIVLVPIVHWRSDWFRRNSLDW